MEVCDSPENNGTGDNNEAQEQEATSSFRPWERPANGRVDSDDDDDDIQEPSSSSRNDNDLPLNVRGRNAPSDVEYQFLKAYAPHVDEGILQTLYRSEGNNPNRLETILVEVLGLENAIQYILDFRKRKRSGEIAGTSYAASEESKRMEFMDRVEEMFPDADNFFILRRCHKFRTEHDFTRFVNKVMLTGKYPRVVRGSRVALQASRRRADTTQRGEIGSTSGAISGPSNSSSNSSMSIIDYTNENEITSSGLIDDDMPSSARKRRRYDSSGIDCLPSTSRGFDYDMETPGTSQTHNYYFRNLPNREVISPSQCLQWYRTRCLIKNIKRLNKRAKRNSARQSIEYFAIRGLPFPAVDSSSSDSSDSDNDSEMDCDVSSSMPKSENNMQSDIAPQCSKAGISSSEKGEEPADVPMDTDDEEMVDGDNAEENESSEPEDPEDWVSKYTAKLIELFPKTDPSYLREQCIEFEGSLEALIKFIEEKLENNDMPQIPPPGQGKATIEVWMEYTENFTPESYLKRIPDPWTRFGNPERNCQKYKLLSSWYLKTKFRNQYVRVINKVLKNKKYNLYLSYRALLRRRNARCRPRKDYECHENRPTTMDIPFLEEMTFIENEARIKKYINDKELEKQREIEEARESGRMMECQCCFDNEVIMGDMIFCPDNHGFCKSCITKYVEIELGQGKCKFSCLNSCDKNITVESLEKALKPELFSKVSKLLQLEEIKAANIENLIQCPFCLYATIMPPEFKVLECLNPECMKESCRFCREPNHVPLRCEEVEKSDEVKMRTYIENKMTEALVRTCYSCKKSFMKEDGCNKMLCSCGAKMCYVCRQPITGYSHFNGQGATDQRKCPLYTTNDELHVDFIQRVAELAKAEVLRANPNKRLMHDPTMYLPTRTLQQNVPGMQHGAAIAVGLEVLMGIPREIGMVDAQAAAAAADAVPPADLHALNIPVANFPPDDLPAANLPPADIPDVDLPADDFPAVDVPAADLAAANLPEADVADEHMDEDNAQPQNNNRRQRRQARPRRQAADHRVNFMMRRRR